MQLASAVPAIPRLGPVSMRELLTFRVMDQVYGFDILAVEEIRRGERVTALMHAPSHVMGVINLRGVVTPIIDLRARLGCPSRGESSNSVVIVTRINDRVAGFVVDSVCEVLSLSAGSLKPIPAMAHRQADDIFVGLAENSEGFVIVADPARLISSVEFQDAATDCMPSSPFSPSSLQPT